MASLIEGWFAPVDPRPYVDDSPDEGVSPRKEKSYLIVYDACAALGSLSSRVFMDCELRLWPENQVLDQKTVHIHGRFSVAKTPGDDDPCLKIEVHRFVVMHTNDPTNDSNLDPTPDQVRTSVTLYGRVTSISDAANDGGADKFFTLEISEHIRDRIQIFHIRSVLLSPPARSCSSC